MLYTVFRLLGNTLSIVGFLASLGIPIVVIGFLGAVVLWNTEFFIPAIQVFAGLLITKFVFYWLSIFFFAQADNIRTNEILKNMDNKREQ